MTGKTKKVAGGKGKLTKPEKKTKSSAADGPLLRTIEKLKEKIVKAMEGDGKFRRFVAVFALVTSTGVKFTVRAVDARTYREALYDSIDHKPIQGAYTLVFTDSQAEFLKNRLEQAESQRAPDIVVRETGFGLRRGR